MVSVGRILRDYTDAGSVNGLLALWGFVDETTFLTKAGHVGVVFRVRGVDYEGVSHPQRQALTHRFEAALQKSSAPVKPGRSDRSNATNTATAAWGRSRPCRAAG